MSIKLIALDLDGTIVAGGTHVFSKKTADAVKKAQENGIKVCIATGRPYSYTEKLYQMLNLDTYMISMCGAVISDKNGKVIFQNNISSDIAKDIVNYSYELGVHVQVFQGSEFQYIHKDDSYANVYFGRCGIVGRHTKSLLKNDDIKTPKVIIMDSDERRPALVEKYKKRYPHLSVNQSLPPYIEMIKTDATKGNALKSIADKYGIKREEVMAIGDTGIDIDMIKFAGVGVAMGNSEMHIKDIADFVTLDLAHDGAALAIEEFCFENSHPVPTN
jgi:Cof subfamily protein (haloacid dehalogenase superfamily)